VDKGFFNPVIIPGFFPDPSICRVGGDYYVATSSFTYFPGVPILHSRDLVQWEQIGSALRRVSQLDLSMTTQWVSAGIYAPTLRFHNDRFWLITTHSTTQGLSNFYVTAEDPGGPWSEPTHIDIFGIDPDLCWDDDGGCWVFYSAIGSIARVRIDEVSGDVLQGPEPTWSGTGLKFPEAPHVYRREDTWYLMIAEGGTAAGHAASIARSASLDGPWEGCPANPILSHRSTNSPIQNIGHADGRYLSTEVAGGFVGRMIGLFAVEGFADFDWFDYAIL
jgi:xylan 1,4-beta-xylosidase